MIKEDLIEQVFRDSLGNYQADVNPAAWENIKNRVHEKSGTQATPVGIVASSGMSSFLKWGLGASVAAGLLALLLLGGGSSDAVEADLTEVSDGLNSTILTEASAADHIEAPLEVLANESGKIDLDYVDKTTESLVVVKSNKASSTVKNRRKNTGTNTQSKLNANLGSSRSNAISNNVLEIEINTGNVDFTGDIVFNPSGISGKRYEWDFGDGSPKQYGKNPVHHFGLNGSYNVRLYVYDSNGKWHKASMDIAVNGSAEIIVPDFFTPDGDNYHDILMISSKGVKKMGMVITNESGDTVFETKSLNGYWTGVNTRGDKVPSGVYTCSIMGVDGAGQLVMKVTKVKLYRKY